MFRIAGLFALFLLTTVPLSAQTNIDDCEKIQQADAYNKCLAAFGPMRGHRAAAAPGARRSGARMSRRAARASHGRVRASFSVRRRH